MPRMWWWWLLFVRFVSYISFIVYGYFLCCEFELLYGETACDRWEDAFWLGWLIQNVAIRQNAKWFREMYNIFHYHSANIFKISKITLHPYSCNILGLHAFILLYTNSLQGWWDTVHMRKEKALDDEHCVLHSEWNFWHKFWQNCIAFTVQHNKEECTDNFSTECWWESTY